MATRLAFLILALVLWAPAALAVESGCLHCHAGHHQQLGSCVDCHGGEGRTRRKDLAHHDLLPGALVHFRLSPSPTTEAGGRLLETFACRRCHVSGGKGNRLASNLDHRAAVRPLELADSIRRPVDFMPNFYFHEADLVKLLNALLLGARNAEPAEAETPRVVHFASGLDGAMENPFVKHCGGCHRMLTGRHGALGRGGAAPNLSGLLTEHYPANFGVDGLPWTGERLKTWLENPRRQRPLAQMRSPALTGEQLRDLLEVFADADY